MRREHHPYWVQRLLHEVSVHWQRHFLLPQFDAIGKDPRFVGAKHVYLLGPRIRVGDHFHAYGAPHAPISLAVNPYEGGAGEGEIVIGDHCVLSTGVRIRSAISVRIGNDVMFAENCFVTDADWHDHYHRIYPGPRQPVRIGDNVWLGDSVTVCKGVTIGDHAIVGARSVVTKDLPARAIAAGNPARVIGQLDPALPMSRREQLFTGPRPYDALKVEYDRRRLAGNQLGDWLRALLWPTTRD